jgi:hypothetical protein
MKDKKIDEKLTKNIKSQKINDLSTLSLLYKKIGNFTLIFWSHNNLSICEILSHSGP